MNDSKQMTLSDYTRRAASLIKAQYRKTRVWRSESHKLAYLSIPKCASSTIRMLITAKQKESSKDHSPARVSLTTKQLVAMRQDYFLFSFVRNPLPRLYSCYRDKTVNAEKRHDRCTFSPYRIHFGFTFDDFVSRVVEIPDKYADQHFRSSSSFLIHDGELLVDFVGKFENLSEDWNTISDRFPEPTPLRTKRISGPPVQLSDIPISSESLQKIIDHYSDDLDAFGYRDDLEALLG